MELVDKEQKELDRRRKEAEDSRKSGRAFVQFFTDKLKIACLREQTTDVEIISGRKIVNPREVRLVPNGIIQNESPQPQRPLQQKQPELRLILPEKKKSSVDAATTLITIKPVPTSGRGRATGKPSTPPPTPVFQPPSRSDSLTAFTASGAKMKLVHKAEEKKVSTVKLADATTRIFVFGNDEPLLISKSTSIKKDMQSSKREHKLSIHEESKNQNRQYSKRRIFLPNENQRRKILNKKNRKAS